MEQADFVHMVRMSEHASAENSRAYRLSVGAFAMLGYAWGKATLYLHFAVQAQRMDAGFLLDYPQS